MGLVSWLFGEPEPKPRRKPTQAQHAQESRERRERANRERSERERGVFEQMDRSYAAGRLVNPRLTAVERSALPDSAFAVPNDHKLPLEDAGHVRNAVARFGQTEFRNVAEARAAARRILEAAMKHDVAVGPGSLVAEVAGVYAERAGRSNPTQLYRGWTIRKSGPDWLRASHPKHSMSVRNKTMDALKGEIDSIEENRVMTPDEYELAYGHLRHRANPGLFDVKPEFGGTRYKPMRKGKPVSSSSVGDFWRPQYEGHKPGETPTSEAERMRQDKSSSDLFGDWQNPTGAGYLDGMGRFHPIRNSPSYSPILSGEDQLLSGYWEHPNKQVARLSDAIAANEMRMQSGGRRAVLKSKSRIKVQRRRLVDLLKRYDRREREERQRYEEYQRKAEQEWSAQSHREWKRELRQAIKAVSPSGIAPHEKRRGGSALGTEYRLDVPINLRNRRGLPPDEVAQLLAYEYPHLGIESEDDLLMALGR